jgi:hypothetical protein
MTVWERRPRPEADSSVSKPEPGDDRGQWLDFAELRVSRVAAGSVAAGTRPWFPG